ncbi:MAG: hypothetical protein V4673_05945 [Pseudomonadota bacterium]
MLRLAPPPPAVRLPPQHPYAALLGALSVALGALDVHDVAYAQALAGIDFDLPEGAPTVEDRVQLNAAAPLYFASELERAGLLPTAELIAGLFVSGAITQPLGPTANLLHDFWRGRRERLDADERNAIYARVIETPHFDRLMRVLCEGIIAQADGVDLREQVVVATHAQSFAAFLAQRVDPMASIAARDIVETINTALVFLRDRKLQAAFAVNDLWRLVAIVGSQNGIPAGAAQQHVERGRSGQTVLLWLANHYADNAIRFDADKPEDVEVIVAAQRWLASLPAASALPMPAAMHAKMPMVA